MALHRRLLEGSRTASSEIAIAYMDYLVWRLRLANPRVDDHFWTMAATDALMSYIKHPRAYDPHQLPLDKYLFMSAQGDLKNHLARERRQHQRYRKGERVPYLRVVELSDVATEQHTNESDDPARYLERRESVAEKLNMVRTAPQHVVDRLTPI
ncbi:MAG TPA: hypothetical protein VFD32_22145, partial [Dehalococcoidia bacterium]|nr:hypothetical protein [Dehalococcoidia bacterium]